MIHLTPRQYRFLLERFDQETFGLREDLDTEWEIVGFGLDTTFRVGALMYDDRRVPRFAFYRIELITFLDGGYPVPNDFDPQRFLEMYRYSR